MTAFLVPHDDVSGLLALAHHVEYRLIRGDFKVEIDLHPPFVGVAGHGIPYVPRQQGGHAHAQLAAFTYRRMDILAENPLVDGFLAAQVVIAGLVHGDQHRRAGAVGGTGI